MWFEIVSFVQRIDGCSQFSPLDKYTQGAVSPVSATVKFDVVHICEVLVKAAERIKHHTELPKIGNANVINEQ